MGTLACWPAYTLTHVHLTRVSWQKILWDVSALPNLRASMRKGQRLLQTGKRAKALTTCEGQWILLGKFKSNHKVTPLRSVPSVGWAEGCWQEAPRDVDGLPAHVVLLDSGRHPRGVHLRPHLAPEIGRRDVLS